ncbi:hypothetical protein [Aquibacillus sediminis]|uniref:hypothetical protein n=1 Tax=Aquibacillus sediminis TaxID=2574734 RepID=UPI0011090C31|nr:hypothetical protein [Aquibacillus sediminis]
MWKKSRVIKFFILITVVFAGVFVDDEIRDIQKEGRSIVEAGYYFFQHSRGTSEYLEDALDNQDNKEVFLDEVHRASTYIRGAKTWVNYLAFKYEDSRVDFTELKEYIDSVDVEELIEMDINSPQNISKISELHQRFEQIGKIHEGYYKDPENLNRTIQNLEL